MNFYEDINGVFVIVVYREFPKGSDGVHEMVTSNNDGSYTIFIDETLPMEGKTNAYLHALKHIFHDDFWGYDVNQIEKSAH